MLVAIVSFLAVLLVLVLVHEFGHFQMARWLGVGVEEFGVGFPPRAWSRKIADTIYSINWLPLGGFVRIKGEEGQNYDPDSFAAQSVGRRAIIVAAGIIMNFILAVLLFTFGFTFGMPSEIADTPPARATIANLKHEIVGVVDGAPAVNVLANGDEIIAIDGVMFDSRAKLQEYIRAHVDKPVTVSFRRSDQLQEAVITPRHLEFDNVKVEGIGVQIFSSGTISYPWWWAPVAAVKYAADILYQIATYFGTMIGKLFTGEARDIEVAGPVGIAVLSGQVAREGFIFLLQFVALLSLNLAFVNVLPFPALDGGRLFFMLIEAVRGRPVSQAVEARLHRIGFAILLGLVLVVTYSDLHRLTTLFR